MILLAPYNPDWSKNFELEKHKLMDALQDPLIRIEHIGSTAIPGIKAKPVIDILVGVPSLEQFENEQIKRIESLGYRYNPTFETVMPHRRYFQKNNAEGQRTHQIHLVNYPSSWWEKHILFRAYLKSNSLEAKTYEAYKIILAKKFNDTISYADAKTLFCREIDKKAYFDFTINKPFAETPRLYGYIPQLVCQEIYEKMFQEENFSQCFGISLSNEDIQSILKRDTAYWDQYGFGPLVWFDKSSHKFVGEGGLNHAFVEEEVLIELTYSIERSSWGKGFAMEIGKYALNQAFKQLYLNEVVCFTMTSNQQSLRVMEKLGFKYVRDFVRAKLPHQLYKITREIWLNH